MDAGGRNARLTPVSESIIIAKLVGGGGGCGDGDGGGGLVAAAA